MLKMSDEFEEFLGKKEIVMLILLFYVFMSKRLFAWLRDKFSITKDGKMFRMFMVLHNALLCVFSGYVTMYSWPLMIECIKTHGFVYFHSSPQFWEASKYWSTVFFISKYYEFVDSWVLVLKGIEPSYLQVYHHTGVVIAMWLAIQNQCNWIMIMVALNSFIHTLMYFYYIFSTLGYKSPLAIHLTTAQLTQFVIGILFSGYSYICNVSMENKLSLLFMHAYAIGLIFLFGEMFQQKYTKKKTK